MVDRVERSFVRSAAGWAIVIATCVATAAMLDHVLAGPSRSVVAADPPRAAPEPQLARHEPALQLPDAPIQERRVVDVAPPRPPSALALLEEHWGDRWPEIRERNQASEDWLSHYPVENLKPWKKVSETILELALVNVAKERENEEFLQIADERGLLDLSAATVHVRTPQGMVRDFEGVRARAEDGEARLRAASTAYWNELERSLAERWRAGDIEHHPILASYDPPAQDALYTHMGVAEGWAYAVELSPGNHPELARLAEALQSLRAAIFEEIADHLGAQ